MLHAIYMNTGRGEFLHTIETDPTKSFTDLTKEDVVQALGLIPQIMFNNAYSHLKMWDALNAGYQHGGGIYEGEAILGEDLSYIFPGDPPLKPLAKYTRNDEVAYQYKYGLMMVEKDGKFIATRMD